MALTPAQIAAIKKQAPKNVATRAALLAKKISNNEAAGAAEKIRKTGTNNYRGTAPGSNAESAAAKATRAAQEKKNADLEKHRRFAKGEKPLATKNRVGTKAEYKALGKEINTKAALHKKAAEIAKKKPAVVAPKAAVEAPKAAAEAPKTASTTRASAQPGKTRTAVRNAEYDKVAKEIRKSVKEEKAKDLTPKKSTAPKTSKTVATTKSPVQTVKATPIPGSDTVVGQKAITSGRGTIAVRGNTTVVKPASKALAVVKTAGKTVGKLGKVAGAVGVASVVRQGVREGAQNISGQSAKDDIRIKKLENKIAVAKGQKPKYKNMDNARNPKSLISNTIGTTAKILTGGLIGQSSKERISQLQGMLKKRESANKGTGSAPWGKPGNAPGAVKKSSGKYRVEHGDTLSGIAQRAGVTLAELRAANPQLKDKGIFRNTGVNIPKGGTKPTPGYTGPVPYKAPKK